MEKSEFQKKIIVSQDTDSMRGFTIIELLIAIGLFTTLIDITSGIFIQSLRHQRNLAALIAANSNAGLTIEQITRETRTGKDFCANANDGCKIEGGFYKELVFTNAKNEKVKYELSDPTLINFNTVRSVKKSINDQESIPITANNVNIQAMSFYIDGNQSGDGKNPRITIIMKISAAGVPFSESIVSLQTTVTPRSLQD